MNGLKKFSQYGLEVFGFSSAEDDIAKLADVFAAQLGITPEEAALYFEEVRMADGQLWVARDAMYQRSETSTVRAVAGTQTHDTGTKAHPARETVLTTLGVRNPEDIFTAAALAAIVHRSLGDGEGVGALDSIAALAVPEPLFETMGRIGLGPIRVSSEGSVFMRGRASEALLKASGILFPPPNHSYLNPPSGLPMLRH